MIKIYRVQFPGDPELDFTVGTQHRTYGDVLDIKETMEVLTYDGNSCAYSYINVIKVIFKDQEIVFQASHPLMVVYKVGSK